MGKIAKLTVQTDISQLSEPSVATTSSSPDFSSNDLQINLNHLELAYPLVQVYVLQCDGVLDGVQ